MAKGGGSTGGGGQSLGRATVEVRADTSQLPADLAAAKNEVRGLGGEVDKLTSSTASFKNEAKAATAPIRDLAKGMHAFVSSAAWVTGVAVAFYELGKAVNEYVVALTKAGAASAVAGEIAANDLIKGLDAQITDIDKKIAEHQTRLGDLQTGFASSSADSKIKAKREQEKIAELNKVREVLDAKKRASADAAIVEKNKQRDLADDTMETHDRVAKDNTERIKRRAAEEEAAEEAAFQRGVENRRRVQQGVDDVNEYLREQRKIIEDINKERLRGILEAQRETRRLLDMQGQGFGAGDSVGTSASFNQRMLNEMRSLRNSVGGV